MKESGTGALSAGKAKDCGDRSWRRKKASGEYPGGIGTGPRISPFARERLPAELRRPVPERGLQRQAVAEPKLRCLCCVTVRRVRYDSVVASTAVETVRDFMKTNLPRLVGQGGWSSRGVVNTGFEVSPREYLAFAEEELAKPAPQNRINCIAHLKRAADCQLDIFLHAFNLFTHAQKNRLSFAAKLQFLDDIALISPRSLRRLNTVRNKMEHEFTIPDLPDLEAYADLVHAFVAVLETTTVLLPSDGSSDFKITTDGEENSPELGDFSIEYQGEKPGLRLSWDLTAEPSADYSATPSDPDFSYFFRVYLLLARRDAFETDAYVLSLL